MLDRMLGQHDAFFSAGELVHLWARGLTGERCGCGAAFGDCDFWKEVGQRAFNGWENVDGAEMVALQHSVDKTRYVPGMLAPSRLSPSYAVRRDRYTAMLAKLYRAVSEVGGSKILIDSSKHPSLAFLLHGMPEIDIRAVLMVRSSHGVAYSWTKEVQKPEVIDGTVLMPQYSPARSALYWTAYNALLQGLERVGVPSVVIQYERLVRTPREELSRVLRLAEQDAGPQALGFISGDSVSLAPSHTVAGNPMRFKQGDIRLRVDTEWQEKLPRRDARIVSALSAPLLGRYGYRLDGTTRVVSANGEPAQSP